MAESTNTVSMETFISTWAEVVQGENPSVKKVATKLNMAEASVTQRATSYRKKHGIDLPRMPRTGTPRLDVKAGKELLAKLMAKKEDKADVKEGADTAAKE